MSKIFLKFDRTPIAYHLPYVLNGPIHLFSLEILMMDVEVDILHNISMLHDILQICKIY